MDAEEMRNAYLRASDEDIVSRLLRRDPYRPDGWVYGSWALEAAKEIERLRLENRELRSEVQRLQCPR